LIKRTFWGCESKGIRLIGKCVCKKIFGFAIWGLMKKTKEVAKTLKVTGVPIDIIVKSTCLSESAIEKL